MEAYLPDTQNVFSSNLNIIIWILAVKIIIMIIIIII